MSVANTTNLRTVIENLDWTDTSEKTHTLDDECHAVRLLSTVNTAKLRFVTNAANDAVYHSLLKGVPELFSARQLEGQSLFFTGVNGDRIEITEFLGV